MDQWNNNVDEEIRVPIKDFHTSTEWTPLGKNSWIEAVERTHHVAGIPVPSAPGTLRTATEWAIAHCDGTVSDPYGIEDVAKFDLESLRETLKMCRVPEEYWPVLMERTVETVASSWRVLSV